MAIHEHLVTSDTAQTTLTRQSPAGVRFDWAFLVPCTWLMIGISLDGWAHNHIPALETFFTPWHGVLYSGYLAVAAFLLAVFACNQRRGTPWQRAMVCHYLAPASSPSAESWISSGMSSSVSKGTSRPCSAPRISCSRLGQF